MKMNDVEMDAHRAENLTKILSSTSKKKVIVAGPGTGKSYTFQRLAEQSVQPVLALTFLGSLAAGLDKELGELADGRTFHGWARSILHRNPYSGVSADVDYYPPLEVLVSQDLGCLGSPRSAKEITAAMVNLDETDPHIDLSIKRGNYYDAVSHTDSIYRVFCSIRSGEMPVPKYGQLMVDEYQDFNRLEATLIRMLSDVSPSLVVGDDDQALYSFKHASADFIRDLATSGEYERFELPYCTRCTSVLVEATNRVVARAKTSGLLLDRLDKPYTCFLPKKRELSAAYPKIIHANCSTEKGNAPYMCKYVASEIAKIDPALFESNQAVGDPTVIIIGPGHLAQRVADYLQATGRTDFQFLKSAEMDVHPLDGYTRVSKADASRLGWRIILHSHPIKGWQKMVAATAGGVVELVSVLPAAYVTEHLQIARLVGRVLENDALTSDEKKLLSRALDMTIADVMEILCPSPKDPAVSPNILITTLTGAKGLQADFVFVLGINERSFPLSNADVSDVEVCQLLVALTRAKQCCTLVSTSYFAGKPMSRSIFIEWLKGLLVSRYIKKDYWK